MHAAVCNRIGPPLAWKVRPANESEHEHVVPLLDRVIGGGFTPGTAALAKGCEGSLIYKACEDRDIRPIIPLKGR